MTAWFRDFAPRIAVSASTVITVGCASRMLPAKASARRYVFASFEMSGSLIGTSDS